MQIKGQSALLAAQVYASTPQPVREPALARAQGPERAQRFAVEDRVTIGAEARLAVRGEAKAPAARAPETERPPSAPPAPERAFAREAPGTVSRSANQRPGSLLDIRV